MPARVCGLARLQLPQTVLDVALDVNGEGALFGIGAGRSRVTRQPWIRSCFEMLLVGAAAAIVAYAKVRRWRISLGSDCER